MLQRTRGIVLHTFKIKDNQLIAVVYTQQWGRMSYITTIPKSHKAGGKHLLLQPLAEVELEADMKPRTSLCSCKSSFIMPFVRRDNQVRLSTPISLIRCIGLTCLKTTLLISI